MIIFKIRGDRNLNLDKERVYGKIRKEIEDVLSKKNWRH